MPDISSVVTQPDTITVTLSDGHAYTHRRSDCEPYIDAFSDPITVTYRNRHTDAICDSHTYPDTSRDT